MRDDAPSRLTEPPGAPTRPGGGTHGGTPPAGSEPSSAAPGASTTTPQTPGPVTTPGPGPSEPAPTPDPTTPSTSSRPDENSAGLPHGTKLDVLKGDLTITKDGTVIDGLDVRGFIRVHADDVLIKNSIVRGRDIGAQNMHLIQVLIGTNLKFINNVMKDTTNAAIMVTQDRGHVSNMLGPLQGIAFRDNTFGTATRHPHCAILSPQSTTVTHSGNAFTDGYRFKISNGG